MLRQLLTLLAIFSGFGLVASPAQAAQVSEITVAITGEAEDCKPVASPVLQGYELGLADGAEPIACRKKRIILPTPTVMLRADRARE